MKAPRAALYVLRFTRDLFVAAAALLLLGYLYETKLGDPVTFVGLYVVVAIPALLAGALFHRLYKAFSK